MSRYTGKCDFCDHIEMTGIDKVMESEIFVGSTRHKLFFETEADLIPYYPHLVIFCSSIHGAGRIILSKDSYLDRLDKTQIGNMVKQAKREFNRCKRKKIPFNVEEIFKKSFYHNDLDNLYLTILKRLEEKGLRAKFNDLHISYFDDRRSELVEKFLKEKFSNFYK